MKHHSPVCVLVFVGLVACSDGEDLEVASAKYAATFCTKVETCGVPKDDPEETQEECRARVENALQKEADGATKSACSKEENEKCRAALEAQDCSAFILETVLQSKLPAACEGC